MSKQNVKEIPCDLPIALGECLLGMNLSVVSCNKDTNNNIYIQVSGGNNGTADWKHYLKSIYSCLVLLQNSYETEFVRICAFDCDDLDDIFYVTFIIQEPNNY